MLTFLEGMLVEKSPARTVFNVGGVGYEVFIPLSSYDRLPPANQTCRILVYDYVREDQHALYGFMTEAERRLFVLLMSVSGIGPKLAMSTLSCLPVREITAAIAGGDVKRLATVSGIGRKIAERMVLELRDKLSAAEVYDAAKQGAGRLADDQRMPDAVLALVSLGYRPAEAQKMIATALPRMDAAMSVEEIVRRALTR